MLLRAQFRRLVAEQIKLAGTAAGDAVYENRALPTALTDLPMIILTTPHEVKVSRGRGAPKFDTTVHLVIRAKAKGATDDLAAQALDDLAEQIELATLGNSAVVNVCQQFSAVESTTAVTAQGSTPVGELTMILQAELYQYYDPAMPDRLAEIDVSSSTDPNAPGLLKIVLPA